MARFLVRRLLGAILVLFAISVIVFLIFNVVPATNPAQRIAGKNATPQLIKNVEKEWAENKDSVWDFGILYAQKPELEPLFTMHSTVQ